MRRYTPKNYREIPFRFLVNAARADVIIGAMARPQGTDEARKTARYLQRYRKDALVSLHERRHYARAIESKGIIYKHIPVADFSVASIKQHEAFYNLLSEQVKRGNRIVVHCGAGDGRSGTMLSGLKLRQKLQQEFLRAETKETITATQTATILPSDGYPTACSTRIHNAVHEIRVGTDGWKTGGMAVERESDIVSLREYERTIVDKYNRYLQLLHRDRTGNTALNNTIDNSDIEMLDLLALRGHHITSNHIERAIQNNKSGRFINNLITRSTDQLDHRDSQDTTLLMLAAKRGRSDIINTLLKYGRHSEARDSHGKTAYIHALDYFLDQTYQLIKEVQQYKDERISARFSKAKADDPRDIALQALLKNLTFCFSAVTTHTNLDDMLKTVNDIQTTQTSSNSFVRFFTPKRSHFDDIAPSIRQLIQFARDGVLALQPTRPSKRVPVITAIPTPRTSTHSSSRSIA